MNAHALTAASLSQALTGRKAEVLSYIGRTELLFMLRDALDRNTNAEPASREAKRTRIEAERIKRVLRSRGIIVAWDGEEITPPDEEDDDAS